MWLKTCLLVTRQLFLPFPCFKACLLVTAVISLPCVSRLVYWWLQSSLFHVFKTCLLVTVQSSLFHVFKTCLLVTVQSSLFHVFKTCLLVTVQSSLFHVFKTCLLVTVQSSLSSSMCLKTCLLMAVQVHTGVCGWKCQLPVKVFLLIITYWLLRWWTL